MPHITFVHGIANKPPAEKLLRDWEDALTQGGLDLGAYGVTTSMVYWADMMYPSPKANDANFESVDEGLGTGPADEDLEWTGSLSDNERAFVESMRAKLRFDEESPNGDDYAPPPPEAEDEAGGEAVKFEAVPLPWFIKRRVMKRLLKDVHHYLFDSSFTPRPGETFQVKKDMRQRFIDTLTRDAEQSAGDTLAVVSHSMGTVIAYDCLKNDTRCPPVSGLLTVGSPLGLSEVQDNLKPGYSSRDGFPSDTVGGKWINIYDRLDPVAFDSHLRNDFRKDGEKFVVDAKVRNSGRWRHSSWKYFGQSVLCDHLKDVLEL